MSSTRPRNLAEAARLDGGGLSTSHKRQRMAAEIAAASEVETPYGPMVKTMTLHGHAIPYICPFALLWRLTHASASFAALLHSRIGSMGRVCLYVDEVMPGNGLRPDHGRGFYSFLWLFLEYPDWLRSSSFGWHDLLVVKTSVVKEIPGGISAFVTEVLRMFWGADDESYNLQRLGVRVAGPQAPYVLRASFGVFLVDERAEKAITSVKGSSGGKPCMSCRNVVGRIDAAAVTAPFRHFSVPGLAGCELQTTATFNADLDYLRAQHGVVHVPGQPSFKEMTQALGIAFDAHSLPYSDMRGCARIPETRYCDWMHNLCASGGVVQYQVNQFCLALETAGLSIEHLDEFQQACRAPHTNQKLRSTFFQDRVRRSPAGHIKAFASEILTVVVILELFCDLVLRPTGVMAEHVSLVRTMSMVLQILRMGDGAVRHARVLADLLLAYHTEFLALMPECCKPKLHYVHHTPGQIERHRVNLSCFGPERKHQMNKQALNYIYRHMEVALTRRNVDNMVGLAQEATTFQPIRLLGTLHRFKATDKGYPVVTLKFGEALADRAQRSISAKFARGSIHRKDVILWGDGVNVRIGSAVSFLCIGQFNIVVVNVFAAREGKWRNTNVNEFHVLDMRIVRCVVTYFKHEDGAILPHIPSYM